MSEILQIFFQLLLFFLLTYFPINKFTFSRFSFGYIQNNYNAIFINIVFILNTFLILSFFGLNLKLVFLAIFIINFFFFTYNFSNIIKEIFCKKNIEIKLAFIIVCCGLFFKTAANPGLGWDGFAHWLPKANNFYLDKSYFEMPYPQYPQLGSYIWAFFWKNSFLQKEYLGRLFLHYLYLVSIFIIVSTLKKESNFKKLIFIFVLLLFTFDYDSKLPGYQDYLIFVILVFCSKILLDINSRLETSKNLFLYFLLIMTTILLPWVKNEGIFYSIFIAIVYFFISTESLIKKFFFLLIISVNIITQVTFVKIILTTNQMLQFPLTYDYIFKNIFNIKELFFRFFYISFYIIRSSFQYPLILINFISIVISFKYFRNIKNIKIFYIFFFLNLIFIYGIYIVTTAPLLWHMQTSLSRLMLQTCGFYSFLIIDLINKKNIKIEY
jgi:hypothetical protein